MSSSLSLASHAGLAEYSSAPVFLSQDNIYIADRKTFTDISIYILFPTLLISESNTFSIILNFNLRKLRVPDTQIA